MKKHLLYFFVSAFLILTSCGGNAENLSEKDLAPDFTLSDAFGNYYTLSELRGNPVVIYFYPKANTSGCTKQACGIRDSRDKFSDNNITVLGISVDSKASISEFIAEHNLNFPLLSDENKEVSRAYGVLNNLGMSSRITFIISRNGTIAKIMKDFDIDKHAEEVFEFASKI
ncbi:MAG TPA: peroxiredoxin [Ignavibacteriaceae bacterium]|nr:peroxiredoxin [Ignavibacteriaceae bacterium]